MNDDTVLQMVMGQMLSRIFTINAQAVPGTAWGFVFSFRPCPNSSHNEKSVRFKKGTSTKKQSIQLFGA